MTRKLIANCDGPDCKKTHLATALYTSHWLHIKLTDYFLIVTTECPLEYDVCSQTCLENLVKSWRQENDE